MPTKRRALRWIELAAVLTVLVVATILALPFLKYNFAPDLPTTCIGNLQQWATVLSMYRSENNHVMPPVQGFQAFGPAENAKGCLNVHDEFSFSPDLTVIIPDYADNPLFLACPDSPYIEPPKKLGPLVTRPWRPNEQAFGVLESESLFSCDYAGAITNGDACYTYFGWRIEPDNPFDRFVDAHMATQFNLPSTGPASIVGLLTYLTVPEDGTYVDVQERREDSLNIRNPLLRLGPNFADRAGSDRSTVLLRMYMGFLFGERIDSEGKAIETNKIAEQPPDRPYYATTPVMWDTIYQDSAGVPRFTHSSPPGLNVLYMD
ncbi:MAG: hypothetical protein WC655_29630, partial [Candidatus Hydrogenedentales bacterium]